LPIFVETGSESGVGLTGSWFNLELGGERGGDDGKL
jgi:hypothetical protein